MGTHLRPIRWQCDHYGCTRPAKQELRNARNAVNGQYCLPHAKQALKEFKGKYPDEKGTQQ